MKRLVGGDFLLDLSAITITETGGTPTKITNEEVLKQLSSLKTFVQNPKMIKPVWVKFYDSEDSELIAIRGEMSFVSNIINIFVKTNYYSLLVYVQFEQVTLDDNTPIDDYVIEDAGYTFSSNIQDLTTLINDNVGTDELSEVLGFNEDGVLVRNEYSSGTKLYKHEINFTAHDIGDIVLSVWVVSQQSTPFSLTGLQIQLGQNALVITDDDGSVYRTIMEDQGDIVAKTIAGATYTASVVDDFEDDVTEF